MPSRGGTYRGAGVYARRASLTREPSSGGGEQQSHYLFLNFLVIGGDEAEEETACNVFVFFANNKPGTWYAITTLKCIFLLPKQRYGFVASGRVVK